ncbi:MAG: phosphoenolpyruvate carboxylase [Planctomycetia bacterium]
MSFDLLFVPRRGESLPQVELLRRLRAKQDESAPEADLQTLHDLLRLTIKGVAAGMRTTG